MKISTQILLVLITLNSCNSSDEDNFKGFIGQEKAQIIERANIHFDDFLEENFNGRNELERTINFLNFIDTASNFKPNWKVDFEAAKEILEKYESSGLRKDFELYGSEKYDSIYVYDIYEDTFSITETSATHKLELEDEMIPINGIDSAELVQFGNEQKRIWDTSYHYNRFGRFQFALSRYYSKDSVILSYLDYKAFTQSSSKKMLASGLKKVLEKHQTLSYGTRLIILFEIYLPYLRSEVQINT